MPAEELEAFERETRRTYQHHSLIDLIRAIVVRRAELMWCALAILVDDQLAPDARGAGRVVPGMLRSPS
jgi:hypothetical protein